MQNQQSLPRWLYMLTPCTLTAVFFIFVILDSYADLDISEGSSNLGIISSIVPLGVVVLLDVLLRLTLKHRFGLIWLIEVTAIALILLLLAYLSGNI